MNQELKLLQSWSKSVSVTSSDNALTIVPLPLLTGSFYLLYLDPVTVCSTVVRVDQHRPKHWTTWIRGLEQPQQPHQRLTKNDIHLTSQSSVTRCDDVSDLMPYHNLRPT